MKRTVIFLAVLMLSGMVFSEPLNIAIIWNNHQPDYYDSSSDSFLKPWVRLHCVKDYYDMAKRLEQFPNMHVTFNMSSSLLRQIDMYCRGIPDKMMVLHRRKFSVLTDSEKLYLLSRCFDINWDNYIKPSARYYQLLQKRGFSEFSDSLQIALKKFTEQDFIDMQVHFNLAWMDESIVQARPYLKYLNKKDSEYTADDLNAIIDLQIEYMKAVKVAYSKLQKTGQAEIVTTPLFHPILPLIYDTDAARKEGSPLLPGLRFSYRNDAENQVKQAIEYYKDIFGQLPAGMWPAEGAISDSTLGLYADNGIKWVATDEQILSRTLNISFGRGKDGVPSNPEILYKPYYYIDRDGRKTAVLFRDTELSDSIGFTYQGMHYTDAADDFMLRLSSIKTVLTGENQYLITIILDGENCWEKYENDGSDFLNEIYARLSNSGDFRTVTVNSYLTTCKNSGALNKIAAGSWVNGDFTTWIGEPEENTAWTYLKIVRDIIEEEWQSGKITKEQYNAALTEVYKAEGSDWFWWYGEDQNSGIDGSFDVIFRTHLINALQKIERSQLELLKKPIVKPVNEPVMRQQFGFFNPVIDGIITSQDEWYGAGYVFDNEYRTFYSGAADVVKTVYYGICQGILNLRFNCDFEVADNTPYMIVLYINNPSIMTGAMIEDESIRGIHTTFNQKVEINLKTGKAKMFRYNGTEYLPVPFRGIVKVNSCCEISIPELELNENSSLEIVALTMRDGIITDVAPNYGTLLLNARLSIPCTFRLSYPSAKKVAVAGDFNDWNKDLTLLKQIGDHWEITVPLLPGEYRYKFVVNDNIWIADPLSQTTVDDGYGSKNSIIVVR